MLGDRAIDLFRADGADIDDATRRVRLDPDRVQELVALRPAEFELHARNPGTERPPRRRPPRVLCGRRPGVRDRPRPRPACRQPRRLRGLRAADRQPRRHPPGRRRTARAHRPAGRHPPPRHVPRAGDEPRQDVALPRVRGDRRGRRAGDGRDRPRRRPGVAGGSAEPDHDHQHELAAAARRPDVRGPRRDGDYGANRWSRPRSRWPAQ